jgi:hypothetical protein
MKASPVQPESTSDTHDILRLPTTRQEDNKIELIALPTALI